MNKVFIGLVFLALIFFTCWFFLRSNATGESSPKDRPLSIGGHSTTFNNSIDTLLSNYFELADAFVNADSVKAKTAGEKLSASISNIPLDELKNDTLLKKDALVVYSTDSSSLVDIKTFSDTLTKDESLDKMRHDFASLNESLYPFLKGINYSGKKLYWYNCGMPFGENTSANWISATDEHQNPYLGKYHPFYKSSMVGCGELMDTIVAK